MSLAASNCLIPSGYFSGKYSTVKRMTPMAQSSGVYIAFQCCKHSSYHIAAENTIVEIVNDKDGPVEQGEKGRILVTNLNNYAMPFIRYDIGDVGVASEKSCSCGRGLPLLDSLEGRSVDVIVTKSRGKISGNYLYYPADPNFAYWGIEKYQIIQEDYENILIKIVPGKEPAERCKRN